MDLTFHKGFDLLYEKLIFLGLGRLKGPIKGMGWLAFPSYPRQLVVGSKLGNTVPE